LGPAIGHGQLGIRDPSLLLASVTKTLDGKYMIPSPYSSLSNLSNVLTLDQGKTLASVVIEDECVLPSNSKV
jgi:hypothetical protein